MDQSATLSPAKQALLKQRLKSALAAEPRAESIEDLRFLQTSFRVYQPLTESLEQFHSALQQHFAGKGGGQAANSLESALTKAKEAQQLAAREFPRPLDPIGGEVGALRKSADRLVTSINMWIGTVRKQP